MKKVIITTILTAFIFLSKAQTYNPVYIGFDSSSIRINHYYKILFRNSINTPISQLSLDANGNVEIQGDTILIIKDILRYYQQQDSTINALKEGINKAVIVTNHIPDNIKKESKICGWEDYQKFLKKLGYEVVIIKKWKK